MIPPESLKDTVQQFIKNYDGEISQLALKGSPFPEITSGYLIQQIEGFRKAANKLPTWYHTPQILFPPKLNLEQTSSEITAKYKASLIDGETLADITGGFGVDAYFFAEKFKKVHHFEQNKELSEIAGHNFKQLKKNNIICHSGNALELIENNYYDAIFADPARRHETKGKVFFLKDCEPNIVSQLDSLLAKCQTLLIKTSPMLDISVGLSELKNVAEIHVVAVNNDVKELLWKITNTVPSQTLIKTINFRKNTTQTFSFDYQQRASATYSNPKTYLYEPNAALLKAGAFQELSAYFSIQKIAPHSHLYTHEKLIDFPGRRFQIDTVFAYHKKTMKNFAGMKANITTRNFPERVNEIKKKWKIKDGGSTYLFFTTLESGEKIVIKTIKVPSE